MFAGPDKLMIRTMKRLDWRLLHPKPGHEASVMELLDTIDELVAKGLADDLCSEDVRTIVALEKQYEEKTTPTCAAVGAPVVEDDQDWESRTIDEYGAFDVDMEIEDYMDARRQEFDCEQCPYASPYSVYPMDPCEFSAGALEEILSDPELWERARAPMSPADMSDLAKSLEQTLADGDFNPCGAIDAEDYLKKSVYFLRFWAEQGFWLRPDDMDPLVPAVGLADDVDEDEDDLEPTYH